MCALVTLQGVPNGAILLGASALGPALCAQGVGRERLGRSPCLSACICYRRCDQPCCCELRENWKDAVSLNSCRMSPVFAVWQLYQHVCSHLQIWARTLFRFSKKQKKNTSSDFFANKMISLLMILAFPPSFTDTILQYLHKNSLKSS